MIKKINAAFFTVILGTIAYALYPQDILDIPISNLTLENMFRLIGTTIFGVLAIVLLFCVLAGNRSKRLNF
ncbi:MAG: hypothetical protein WA974_03530 [Thermodesulfobacteriota bacterium]